MKKLRMVYPALLLVLAISGCQEAPRADNPTTPSAASSYTPKDYPIVWLPTPNLDLDSADGTFVRAFAESIYRSYWLDWSGVAPGFREAFEPMMRIRERNGHTIFYRTDSSRRAPPHVTYMWVAPFLAPGTKKYPWDHWKSPSASIGGAAVCASASLKSAQEIAGGSLQFFNYRRIGISPPTESHGPLPLPTRDVFGDWHATDWILPMDDRCEQRPPGTPPLRNMRRPSWPGWPADSQ